MSEQIISNDTEAPFLDQARQAYKALEQAIGPIDTKVEELQKDWEPRSLNFWRPVLRTDIPAIRKARAASTQLFNSDAYYRYLREADLGTSAYWECTIALDRVEREIEETGIVFTAHLLSAESSIERQIRERQRLMGLLKNLSKAVHNAACAARTKLGIVVDAQEEAGGSTDE